MINRVMFIGSKKLGLRALQRLYEMDSSKLCGVITFDDGNDERSKLDEFIEYCKKENIELFIIKKNSELIDIIKNNKPELCMVICWYWIIANEVLELVPKGFLGIHASLLPKYRGNAPLVWAMINGEKKSGISLFYLNTEMDEGNIVGQLEFEIEDDDSIKEVLEKVESLSIDILSKYYPQVIEGTAISIPQNHLNASYCAKRCEFDGKINWNLENRRIYNFIRAQTKPYPGAYTYFNDNKKMYILEAEVFPYEYYGTAGLVAQVTNNKVVVTCGKGALILKKVQIDGEIIEDVKKVLKFGDRLK